jgi:hypothetical protein
MATVTFDGVTLWNDAATGTGRPELSSQVSWPVYQIEYLIRSGGKISKEAGVDPGRFSLAVTFKFTGAEVTAYRNTVNGLIGRVGTLIVPDQPNATNCQLAYAPIEARGPVAYFSIDNGIRRNYQWIFIFERLGR